MPETETNQTETTTEVESQTKEKTTSKFGKKIKKFFRDMWLKIRLLWIWFLKNIVTFIQTFCVVCIILCFCDVIKPETPILGFVFEGLNEQIEEWKTETSGATVFLNIAAAISSVGWSFYWITTRMREVAFKDIKSRKLKEALVEAHMYFDENGSLCKRVETATKIDIDGDGKVGDTDAQKVIQENPVKGLFRSWRELKVILAACYDDDDDAAIEQVSETLKSAELADTLTAINSITEEETTETTALISDAVTADDETREEAAAEGKIAVPKTTLKQKVRVFISSLFGKVDLIKEAVKETKNEETAAAASCTTEANVDAPAIDDSDKNDSDMITVVDTSGDTTKEYVEDSTDEESQETKEESTETVEMPTAQEKKAISQKTKKLNDYIDAI